MAKTLAQGRKPGSGRKPGKGKTLREGRKPGSGRRRRQVTSTATGLLKDNAVITSGSTVFTNQQQISLRDIEAADALTELTNSRHNVPLQMLIQQQLLLVVVLLP